ncbi:EAL domain-containing protein [Piscinibacter koreensis]|uniref:EAL domain-containing protein n=1 Tax=Piscinibacter koreensis TaxID=2742824 RepID=A0A7Y6NJC5_9BURK|nr:EAL domain-containing protein [Schlegelella koreensis]NUZ04258.1 EAL domain-containing protein [Schlegelella koreensis]
MNPSRRSADLGAPAAGHAGTDLAGDIAGVRQRNLFWAALVLLLSIGAVTWYFVNDSQLRLIEYKALNLAEVVARHATAARSAYADHAVSKLDRDGTGSASANYLAERGNVPLPAQFLKLVGERASTESGGLYRYRPLSKWNLGAGQELRDDFQRWAWARLEAQDRAAPTGPIAWQSAWRIEQVDGERTLRFLRADPASSASCVQCHNAIERLDTTRASRVAAGVAPGKQWSQHQLLGALEVQVPLAPVEALAAEQRRVVILAVIGLTLGGLLCLGLLVKVGTDRSRALTQDLAWRAAHDDLTGLANRPEFQRRLQTALAASKTAGRRHSLMFLDLDQFKVVNDTCGHRAGDELLRQIGTALRSHLRAGDTLARLGGDEFGVLLVDCPLDDGRGVADKLLGCVANHRFLWRERVFELGVSIGLVEVGADACGVADLMSAADIACYAAKEAGRNRVRVFQSSDAELARRREDLGWGERILAALASGRMALAVQTARPLHERLAVRSYQELLLRMYAEDGTPVPTANVIAAGERYQMMPSRIDRWVLQTACEHVRTGRLRADAEHIVAINISGASLADEAFLHHACETVRASGIDPRGLCFEVTETAAIGNFLQASAFIRALKALGCRFALDDFGSGLSSFSYLKNLPVDFLKLDGAFVRDIVSDPVDRAMVGAIHAIGRALGIPTIAEWVETDAIRDAVQALGIDYAQGYGIERPRLVSLPSGLDADVVEGKGRERTSGAAATTVSAGLD